MKRVMEYLLKNPDVLVKVKNGTASLVGVSVLEKTALMDVLSHTDYAFAWLAMSYWK